MKRLIVLVSLLSIFSMLLMSCAPAATATQAPAKATDVPAKATDVPKKEVNITFWKHNHTPADPLAQTIIDEYMKLNPNVKIKMEIIPNTEHLTKMLAAVAGGQAPDMYDMNDTNVAVLISKGALAPLEPVAVGFKDQKELDAAYVPNSLDAFKGPDGKIFAIPFEYNSWPLLINDKMFKEDRAGSRQRLSQDLGRAGHHRRQARRREGRQVCAPGLLLEPAHGRLDHASIWPNGLPVGRLDPLQ